MRARLFGASLAIVVVALDPAAKLAALRGLDDGAPPRPFLPFVDLSLRLNPGVSFSLLPQRSALGVAGLVAFAAAAAAVLGIWLFRSRAWLTALGVGAILGGAVGNAIDRFVRGAVVDFLDLHALGRHFFVFNIADAAINVGVALIIIEALYGAKGERRS